MLISSEMQHRVLQ